ncbi:MAG TPA: SDR family oxidoreductase [Candidatus Acidoferrales bacterium]|nr:SDR family oxidoreductase [Candidatus Acidoferrales bacterium]
MLPEGVDVTRELENKVCLIAGASGAIGSAVCELFCRHGAQLALGSCAHQAAVRLAGRAPVGRTLALPFDVCSWDEVCGAFERVQDHFGGLDVLVNCVGIQGPIGPTHTLAPDEWARTIEVNLLGAFHLIRAAVPLMLHRGGGKIIQLAGGGAAYARPFFTAYSAAKSALVRFTECLAEELRDANIQVNAIAPGPVRSRMWDEMRAAGAACGPKALREIAQLDETGGVPASRAAALALFLASPRSNGLTGRLISGVHDRWEDFPGKISEIMNTEGGTLRRVPLG